MKIILITVVLFISACTNDGAARNALSSSGFTNISTGDYSFFACGSGDIYSTKFTATNPNGKVVSGVVCTGLFKSSTVRF